MPGAGARCLLAQVERDLAITRAKEAESILEAKREALNDKYDCALPRVPCA